MGLSLKNQAFIRILNNVRYYWTNRTLNVKIGNNYSETQNIVSEIRTSMSD